jgi:hypothetical protein
VNVVDDTGATICSATGSSIPAGETVFTYCSPGQTSGHCTASSNSSTNTKLLVISGAALGNDFASVGALSGLGL